MTTRSLRDELEDTHARLTELTRAQAAGFELAALQVELQARLTELTARAGELEQHCAEARQAERTTKALLVDAMEGRALDTRAMTQWEYRLLLRLDGGRLFGGFVGFVIGGVLVFAGVSQGVSALALLPFGLLAAGLNGWVRGREQRPLGSERTNK